MRKNLSLAASGLSLVAVLLLSACSGQAPAEPDAGSPLPTPTPDAGSTSDGGVTCTTEQHTAGGPDGMGGCWPGPHNTGVPDGVTLTAHTDSCNITTANTVFDGRIFDCELIIRAENVVIRNSIINGTLWAEAGGSFTIEDSEVRMGTVDASGGTGIGSGNFIARRVEVTGGNRSILCERDCRVEDSWVHGQSVREDVYFHASGIRQSQGSVLIHNSITCDIPNNDLGGGCSAGLTGYGDFEPVKNNRIEKNLFIATTGGACAYGGASGNNGSKEFGADSEHIVFVDNVFQRGPGGKCGFYFPVTDFDSSRPGNEWTNNRWDDGDEVDP